MSASASSDSSDSSESNVNAVRRAGGSVLSRLHICLSDGRRGQRVKAAAAVLE